jgi:hypothetical protein
MPLRPSTPVLARHASTEEDLPYVELHLHLLSEYFFVIFSSGCAESHYRFPNPLHLMLQKYGCQESILISSSSHRIQLLVSVGDLRQSKNWSISIQETVWEKETLLRR